MYIIHVKSQGNRDMKINMIKSLLTISHVVHNVRIIALENDNDFYQVHVKKVMKIKVYYSIYTCFQIQYFWI